MLSTIKPNTSSIYTYMDLVYILAGIFISAIAVALVLAKINGTLI